MSQALEDYKNHQFHTNWQYLKNEVYSKYKPEEISDTTELESYSVINKQLEFIDNWLKLIDPELVDTVAVLNNINSRIIKITNNVADYQHKTQYIAIGSGRVVTNIEQTKNYLADCIKEIIKLPIVIPKITSHSITRMLNNYRDTIQQALAEINLEKTKNDAIGIKNYKQELIDNEDSISKTIEKEFKDIENKYYEINKFYNETLVDGKNSISTKQEILKGKESIFDEIEQIKNRIDNFNEKLDELNKFYENIFGSSDKQTIGLKQELESRIKQLDKMQEEHKQKYQTMFDEIEDLLAGATNAGLAEAYNKEREKYSKPTENWEKIFYMSVVLLLLWGIGIYYSYQTNLNEFNSFTGLLVSIFRHSIITIAIILLIVHANNRRRENQRLEQEYAHKAVLAKSYLSYKKQIEDLQTDDPELLNKLMGSTIDSIAYNPSPTLDKKHGDGTLLSEISKSVKDIAKGLGNLNKK